MRPRAREEILAALGSAVAAKRRARGLSQDALSAKSALNRTYISQVERGLRNVSLVNLTRIAQALEIEVAELLREAKL